MAKPQPLIVAPVGNAFSFGSAPNVDVPATPDEKVAASALLTLLSSPSLNKNDKNEAPNGWAQPALKRQKSDPSLKRRVLSSYGTINQAGLLLDSSHPTSGPPSDPAASVVAAVTIMSVEDRDVASVVARALNGEQVEPAKLEEAEKWLYQSVELVRGKYKGRVAVVVGMTAKKYRVRVDGVEHQLEFYPTMFKNPVSKVSVPNPEKIKMGSNQALGSPKPLTETTAPVAVASIMIDGDTRSGSSAGARSVSQDTCPNTANTSRGPSSPAVVPGSTGLVTKTSADLLRLMEETNVEMQKARSMLASFPPSPAGKAPPTGFLASSQHTQDISKVAPALGIGPPSSGKGEAETSPNRPAVMGQSTHPNQSPQLTGVEGKKVVQDMLTEVQEDKAGLVNVMLANPVKATEVISKAMKETHIFNDVITGTYQMQ